MYKRDVKMTKRCRKMNFLCAKLSSKCSGHIIIMYCPPMYDKVVYKMLLAAILDICSNETSSQENSVGREL